MRVLLLLTMLMSIFAILRCVFLIIKIEIVYKNHMKILDAIRRYKRNMMLQGIYKFEVDYDDMESLETTVHRLGDFGYENILPRYKFEIIKDYIF